MLLALLLTFKMRNGNVRKCILITNMQILCDISKFLARMSKKSFPTAGVYWKQPIACQLPTLLVSFLLRAQSNADHGLTFSCNYLMKGGQLANEWVYLSLQPGIRLGNIVPQVRLVIYNLLVVLTGLPKRKMPLANEVLLDHYGYLAS